jgi:hypothetical protein
LLHNELGRGCHHEQYRNLGEYLTVLVAVSHSELLNCFCS